MGGFKNLPLPVTLHLHPPPLTPSPTHISLVPILHQQLNTSSYSWLCPSTPAFWTPFNSSPLHFPTFPLLEDRDLRTYLCGPSSSQGPQAPHHLGKGYVRAPVSILASFLGFGTSPLLGRCDATFWEHSPTGSTLSR